MKELKGLGEPKKGREVFSACIAASQIVSMEVYVFIQYCMILTDMVLLTARGNVMLWCKYDVSAPFVRQ